MAKKESTKETASTIAAKAAYKIAADVLKKNPDMKEVYVTSDGTAFYTRNDAQNHANTLQNREVFSTKRGESATAASSKTAASQTPTTSATDNDVDELSGEATDNETTNTGE